MPRHQICSIPGCSSRSDRQEFEGVTFHCIPQDPDLRHDWLVSIKKLTTVSENSRICSLHFEGSEKTADSPLPSIFPGSVSVKHRQPPAIRNPLPSKKQKHEKPPTPTEVKLDIAYDVLLRGAKFNIPPFLKDQKQLSKKNVILTHQIASLRIHVERAIGRIKQYRR